MPRLKIITTNQRKAGERFQRKISKMLRKEFFGVREEVEFWNKRRADFWSPLEKLLVECKSSLYEGVVEQILDYERLIEKAQKKIIIIGNWGTGKELLKEEAARSQKEIQELYIDRLTKEEVERLGFEKIYVWCPMKQEKQRRRRKK